MRHQKKSNNVKLDPKNKYSIESVELGTIDWYGATVTNKGEILWDQARDGDYFESGWILDGVDLSAYGGMYIELAPNQNQNIEFKLRQSDKENGYNFPSDGKLTVFFNGAGKTWGNLKNPDLSKGVQILICAHGKYTKTVIKKVELIRKEDVPDTSFLEILGCEFGSHSWQAKVYGNEITWPKGTTAGDFGWNLSGVDLSEYDRVRIELESNTAKNIGVRLTDGNHENWHGFDKQIEPNVYEVVLTGEGASWDGEGAALLDKSKGVKIFLQTWNNDVPFTSDYKTVIKSVQLLKGAKEINGATALNGVPINNTSRNQFAQEDGTIEWVWDGKDKYPYVGWNVKNVDLSAYKKLRIELDYTDVPLDIRFMQREGKECHLGYGQISPTVIEAYLDGKNWSWAWPEGSKWNPDSPLEEIHIRACGVSKKGLKSKIKSITLLTEDNSVSCPDRLMLGGAKLGSKKDNAWLDENFVINWEPAKNMNCGWNVEKLEGDILEIKIASSDVPLKLSIFKLNWSNGKVWMIDNTNVFRINLKTRKQLTEDGKEIAPLWEQKQSPVDFSEGAFIYIEPANTVTKSGKKTVIEYVKVE